MLGVSDKELDIIEQLIRTGTFIPRTDEELRLLVRRIIIEYRNPEIRYAVHPAIKSVIEAIIETRLNF